MEQFTPDVSDADVERIVLRDMAPARQDEIRAIIRQLEVREKPRVVLACLKLADGDVARLKRNLAEAAGYWREIIGDAEYPNYTRKLFRIDRLTADERARIIDKDREQYLAWLDAGGNPQPTAGVQPPPGAAQDRQ
jgi:hypothetical protein